MSVNIHNVFMMSSIHLVIILVCPNEYVMSLRFDRVMLCSHHLDPRDRRGILPRTDPIRVVGDLAEGDHTPGFEVASRAPPDESDKSDICVGMVEHIIKLSFSTARRA